MAEGPVSRTAGNREASGSGENTSGKTWSTLDVVALKKIFRFLDRQDQYRMAQVCENWSKGLYFGCVWKFFVFTIRSRLPEHTIDETYFADKYGHLFLELEIKSEEIENSRLTGFYFRRLKKFMDILTPKSRLILIAFIDFHHCLSSATDATYRFICRAIEDFLGSNQRLKVLSFNGCFFKYSYGIRILRSAIHSNSGIVHLILGFFVETWEIDPDDSADDQILPEILNLSNLESFSCDYRMVLGENSDPSQVFEWLKNCQKDLQMDIIFIICAANSRSFKRLLSEQWNILKAENPNLRIKMYIVTSTDFQVQVDFFIVPDFPITTLDYTLSSRYPNFTITHLIDFLVNRNSTEYLEYLILVVYKPINNLDSIFLPFLRKCKKLESFKLHLPHPANSLETFLDSLQECKPESLNEIKLIVNKVPDEKAKQTLANLTSQYQPRLASVQIALEIELE